MSQVKKKFIESDAVDGAKLRLDNDQYLRGRNQADTADINMLKVSTANDITMDASLIPTLQNKDLGASGNEFANIYTDKIFGQDNCGARNIDVTQGVLVDTSAVDSVDWASRTLKDSSGDVALAYSQGGATGYASIQSTNTGGTPAARELRLWDNQNSASRYVALKSPDGLAAQYTLTLPADDGTSGQLLSTDGAGVLSWANDASGNTPQKELFTLVAGDITNGFVDLANVAVANSIDFVTSGLVSTETVDYTVSLTGGAGGNTRIDFSGHTPALVATDVVIIKYQS